MTETRVQLVFSGPDDGGTVDGTATSLARCQSSLTLHHRDASGRQSDPAPHLSSGGHFGGAAKLDRTHLVIPDRAELDVIAVLPDLELALGTGTHRGLLRE